jgi:tetratricopeptide (TPR) repeat protein
VTNSPKGYFTVLLFVLGSALFGQSATEIYQAGSDALMDDRFYEAVESFKSALEQNPRYLEPLTGLAESYFALSEYDEALVYVLQARGLDRTNTRLIGLEGRIRIGLAQFAEARSLFELILLSEPNSIDAKFGLAELEIAFGQSANAANLYEEALAISPYNRRALLSLVLIFDEAGNTEVADRYLSQVLDFHPEHAQVQYIAAKHRLKHSDYHTAEYHALVSLDLNPEYLDATLLLSQIYLAQGEHEKAVEMLQNVLSEHRDEAMIWYNLGAAFSLLGRVDEAIQAFARAFKLQPDDEISRIALENLVIETTEIGAPLRERFAQYHFQRGQDLMDRDYLDRALQEFRRGLVLTPRARDGRLQYASVNRMLDFEAKYLSELKVIRDLGSDDREIADRIEIAESLQRDGLAVRWRTSQYDLERYRHSLMVFYPEGDMLHFLAERDIAEYYVHLLLRYDTIDVIGSSSGIDGFGDAYREARTENADYFLVLDVEEGLRHFAFGWRLYSGSTGTKLADSVVLRTGNERVVDALRKAAADAVDRLPFYGDIVDREFDTMLIDAGWRDGVAVDDELLIIRREVLDASRASLDIGYGEDDVLGTIEITEVDELVSEGHAVKDPFFDLINLGDRVISKPSDPDDEDGSVAAPAIPNDLYRSILRIR